MMKNLIVGKRRSRVHIENPLIHYQPAIANPLLSVSFLSWCQPGAKAEGSGWRVRDLKTLQPLSFPKLSKPMVRAKVTKGGRNTRSAEVIRQNQLARGRKAVVSDLLSQRSKRAAIFYRTRKV
jgi:hypothetical protein